MLRTIWGIAWRVGLLIIAAIYSHWLLSGLGLI